MEWTSFSCRPSTGDVFRLVRKMYAENTDELLLEALAQYDPEKEVLAGMTQEQKVDFLIDAFDLDPRLVDLGDGDDEHHERVATS